MQTPSWLDRPLAGAARIYLLLLIVPLLLSFTQALWRISMEAPQYPDGLSMQIYAYKLTGGHDGQDINEINELNHYIGMQKIERSRFADLDWIPFAFGILILLALRVAVIGNVRSLIDLLVLSLYVSIFAGVRFVYQLWIFGHDLDPHAPVRIQPFMPVVIGTKQVANFTTHGLPQLGTLLVGVFGTGLLVITGWQVLAARLATQAERVAPVIDPELVISGHPQQRPSR